MEFREVNSISFPFKVNQQPFCLKSSKNGHYSILSRNIIEVMKLKYTYLLDANSIYFEYTEVLLNQSVGCDILKNEQQIFDKANEEEKHEILLDNKLIPGVGTGILNVKIIGQEWSPINMVEGDGCLLATLTNFGVLEIHWWNSSYLFNNGHQREWTPIINLTEKWCSQIIDEKKTISSFSCLKSTLTNSLIKTFCWKDTMEYDKGYIACVVESGKLLIWSISKTINSGNFETNLHNIHNCENFKIVTLKWITLPTESQGTKHSDSFLFTGCADGRIMLFRIQLIDKGNNSNCTYIADLWSESDDIGVSFIETEYCIETKNILIITVKGSHLIFFLLNLNGDILKMEPYYVGNLSVISVTQINNFNYLICTLSGYMISIEYKLYNSDFDYKIYDVKHNMDLTKWVLYGCTTSHNKCLWMFITYPVLAFDHLILRSPTNAIICSLNTADPYEILLNAKELRLTNYFDAAELIRQICSKTKAIKEKFVEPIDINMEINDNYIFRMKLKLVIYGSISGYYRRRNNRLHLKNLSKFEKVTQIIEAINVYRILNNLSDFYQRKNTFSKLQALSAKSLRTFLKYYLNLEFVDKFKTVQTFLANKFQAILEQTEYFDAFDNEICLYCSKEIENDKFTCVDGHQMTRCLFSHLQVPLFQQKWCSSCKRECLENDKELSEILFDTSNELLCPICDSIIVSK